MTRREFRPLGSGSGVPDRFAPSGERRRQFKALAGGEPESPLAFSVGRSVLLVGDGEEWARPLSANEQNLTTSWFSALGDPQTGYKNHPPLTELMNLTRQDLYDAWDAGDDTVYLTKSLRYRIADSYRHGVSLHNGLPLSGWPGTDYIVPCDTVHPAGARHVTTVAPVTVTTILPIMKQSVVSADGYSDLVELLPTHAQLRVDGVAVGDRMALPPMLPWTDISDDYVIRLDRIELTCPTSLEDATTVEIDVWMSASNIQARKIREPNDHYPGDWGVYLAIPANDVTDRAYADGATSFLTPATFIAWEAQSLNARRSWDVTYSPGTYYTDFGGETTWPQPDWDKTVTPGKIEWSKTVSTPEGDRLFLLQFLWASEIPQLITRRWLNGQYRWARFVPVDTGDYHQQKVIENTATGLLGIMLGSPKPGAWDPEAASTQFVFHSYVTTGDDPEMPRGWTWNIHASENSQTFTVAR